MKTMRLKLMFVLTMLAIIGLLLAARGDTPWTSYPFAQYPGIVTGDWTFMLGSPTSRTNRQLSMSNMLLITKTNAQAGMQPLSANLTSWAGITPASKQAASGNLDLWSAVTPSQYQTHSSGLDLWSGVASVDPATLQISGGVLSVIGGVGGGQPASPNLTNWSAIATSSKQDHSANLDSWSALATSAKQDASANLTSWSALAPSSKQDASANLSSWSALATSAKQDHSANLDSWSALATSAKQDALGFTPLTFVQTSNLILTLTVPLDSLATNGQVSLFGIDSSTNPVPVHLGNNLSFSANGVGGYDLNASGGGAGASALVRSNIYVRDTNAIILDFAKAQTFSVGNLTNGILILSNAVSITNLASHDIQINFHQWTNGGAKLLTLLNAQGKLTTNGSWIQTTNSNTTDILIARVDGTMTNVVITASTNCSTYVDTNSLLVAGGGGTFPTGADVDWRFNNSLADSSGNGNTGSLTNGTANYTTDEHSGANGALLFGTNNGNALWIQASSSSIANYTGDFSASMWVRFDRDFALAPIIFSKGTFDGGGYYFQVHYAVSGDFHAGFAQLVLNKASAGGASQTVSTGDREIAPDNTWMNIIVVRNGTTVTTYLNGTALTMSGNPTSITLEATSFLLRVGNYSFADDNPSTDSPFIGAIAQFTIWPRALNSTERGQVVSGGSL